MFSYTKNKLYYYKVRKKLYRRQLSEFYVFRILFRIFNAIENAEMTKLMLTRQPHFANFNHL
jgi:hypothetical protein